MPIYSRKYTIPAASEKDHKLEVEGDVITYVRIRFPPGPNALLGVSIFYGIKQIFPYEENTMFYGDDEFIDWDEYWELPESPCTLIIQGKNDDNTYEHTFYLVINVQKREYTLAGQIATKITSGLRRLLVWI